MSRTDVGRREREDFMEAFHARPHPMAHPYGVVNLFESEDYRRRERLFAQRVEEQWGWWSEVWRDVFAMMLCPVNRVRARADMKAVGLEVCDG